MRIINGHTHAYDLWDYLAALLQSPRCPRSAGVIDRIRRAATELGAFLEIDALAAGTTPLCWTASTSDDLSPTNDAANATGCRRWHLRNLIESQALSPW